MYFKFLSVENVLQVFATQFSFLSLHMFLFATQFSFLASFGNLDKGSSTFWHANLDHKIGGFCNWVTEYPCESLVANAFIGSLH